MKVYYVELVMMKLGPFTMDPVDEESRLFSSMEKAEEWLTSNGFVYGQRSFFYYRTDGKEWFHKDDVDLEYVNVDIIEMDMDDLSESKFKNLEEIHREWLPEFCKEVKGYVMHRALEKRK